MPPAHPPSEPRLLWRGGGAPVESPAPLAVGKPVQSQPSPLGRSSLKGAQAGPSAGHGVGGASGEVLAKFLSLRGEAWGNGGGKGIPASQIDWAKEPPPPRFSGACRPSRSTLCSAPAPRAWRSQAALGCVSREEDPFGRPGSAFRADSAYLGSPARAHGSGSSSLPPSLPAFQGTGYLLRVSQPPSSPGEASAEFQEEAPEPQQLASPPDPGL